MPKFNAAFKRWFKRSAVVNDDGTPRVVYHGTRANEAFTEFKLPTTELGIHFGTIEQASQFVTEDGLKKKFQETTDSYTPEELEQMKVDDPLYYEELVRKSVGPQAGDRIFALYASIQNPLRLPDTGSWSADDIYGNKEAAKALIDNGVVTADGIRTYTELRDEMRAERNRLMRLIKRHRAKKRLTTKAKSNKKAVKELTKAYGAPAGLGAAALPPLDELRAEMQQLDLDLSKYEMDGIVTLRKRLTKAGFDGVVYQNTHEGRVKTKSKDPRKKWKYLKQDSYVVWNPAQLKSATGNSGTWSMRSPNILQGVGFGGLRSY